MKSPASYAARDKFHYRQLAGNQSLVRNQHWGAKKLPVASLRYSLVQVKYYCITRIAQEYFC